MAAVQEDPLEEYVAVSQSLPEAGGPWGIADISYPLAQSRLQTLMGLHNAANVHGGPGRKASFVKTYAAEWSKRTGRGVSSGQELPQVLTSKRSCKEVLSSGCLSDRQLDAPGFAAVRGILECIIAPTGAGAQSEQMMLRVSAPMAEPILVPQPNRAAFRSLRPQL